MDAWHVTFLLELSKFSILFGTGTRRDDGSHLQPLMELDDPDHLLPLMELDEANGGLNEKEYDTFLAEKEADEADEALLPEKPAMKKMEIGRSGKSLGRGHESY